MLSDQFRYSSPVDFVALKKLHERQENAYRRLRLRPISRATHQDTPLSGGACFRILQLLRAERPQSAHHPDRIDIEVVSDELNGISIDAFTNQPRPLLPVHFPTISDLIADNEASRIYLGIHWRFDQNRGTASGRLIGEQVYRTAYNGRKFHR